MREVLALVEKVACSDMPILIQGELGVGKTTVAREIHRRSRHAAGPFVHIACGAVRESELDATLFGPLRNCFPADQHGRPSLLSSSDLGTVFLDDVCELPLWAQIKLLDCLQQPRTEGQEGNGAGPMAARVISATTRDLAAAMARNSCYAGLYYYLNVVQIDIAPLRHRQEDIRALAEHFLASSNAMRCSPPDDIPRRFAEEAWQTLLSYGWPGNVLQLGSVVARAVMLAEGTEIGAAELATFLGETTPQPCCEVVPVPLAGGLKQMELAIINEVLHRCRGNKAAAARSLKLHRRTLYRLLEE